MEWIYFLITEFGETSVLKLRTLLGNTLKKADVQLDDLGPEWLALKLHVYRR